MLIHPQFDTVALRMGPLAIHWYGLMYVLGFLGAWALACYRMGKMPNSGWSSADISDLIFYSAIGVIIGGRIGYMLIYDFPGLAENPLNLFKVWQGGMSFHGGFVGVLLALSLFCRIKRKRFIAVSDFVMPLVPLGLAAGRMGNFINGELWGRVTNVPWAMIYPNVDNYPRHPSQLYEFFLEGVVLFIIVWCYSAKARPPAAVTGVFLVGYSLARMLCECFRQPDPQLGFLAFGWLTMGQLLSIPLLLLGIACFMYSRRVEKHQ